MMDIQELNEQLRSYVTVDPYQFEKLQWYLAELLKWNRKINLTSIVDIDQCWEKHIVDSLLASCFVDGDEHVLDIGSGAGFPSIPLKIVYENLVVDSVDSVSKKISFQRHCVRNLAIKKFSAHAQRIEALPEEMAGQFDIVISRAFTSLIQFVEIAAPFLNSTGKIIAMKGSAADDELLLASATLQRLGLTVVSRKEVFLVPSKSKRVLIEIKRQDSLAFL